MASSIIGNEVSLFFGSTGSGKSSTINKICGAEVCVVSNSGTSETKDCKLITVNRPESVFHGKHLLDMQGFHDTRVDETVSRLFEKMKLYFLGSNITKVRSIVFVVSLTSDRNDYYVKFAQFLGKLFHEDYIKKNALVLVTKGDRLEKEEKNNALKAIEKSLSGLNNNIGWSMKMIQWSNKVPLLQQENNLFDAMAKMSGFDPKHALQVLEEQINDEVKRRYESSENIQLVHHDAKQELTKTKTDRQVENVVTVDCSTTKIDTIPAEIEQRQYTSEKVVHFKGHIQGEGGIKNGLFNGLIRTISTTGIVKVVSWTVGEREEKKGEDLLEFPDPVVSIKMDRSSEEIHLLDSLTWEYASNDKKKVKIIGNFSWGGSVVMSWDFDVRVTATLQGTTVKKEAYTKTVVVPQTRVEKVMTTVRDIDKKLVTVKEAYEEKIYKKTKEEIKKLLIQERIVKMT